MWIPKDERRLLVGYYRSIHAVGSEREYGTSEFAEFLYCQTNSGVLAKDIEQAADVLVRCQKANKVLSERGLIICTTPHSSPDVRVSLTVEGYDLGWRYSHRLGWINVFLQEYRWIGLIIAAIGGAVIVKAVEWLWSYLAATVS